MERQLGTVGVKRVSTLGALLSRGGMAAELTMYQQF